MGSSSIFNADTLSQILQNGIVTQDGQDLTSGRRSRNFIRNRSAYRNTNGWTDNTATVTRTTTSAEIVDGVASLKFAAGTTSSHYVSNAFTINNIQKSQPLNISFDFITQSGAAGDWEVGIYDVTAAAYIPVSAPTLNSLGNLPAGNGTFNAFFIASTNTSYELRIIRRSGSGTFSAANFDVFQQVARVGAAISTWQSYTPTFTGFGTIASSEVYWRQVGDSIEIQARFATGTHTAVEARVSLPTGLTVGSQGINLASVVGTYIVNTTSVSNVKFSPVVTAAGVNYVVFGVGEYTATLAPLSGVNGTVFQNSQTLSFFARVPISQWQSGVQMADRAVEEYAYNTSTTDADDTTSFGYGVTGVNFGAYTTATRTKRCQFQTPAQATDHVGLEIFDNGQWQVVPMAGIVQSYITQGTNSYGMGLIAVSGSTTQFDVTFQAGGRLSNNATYAGAGATWSGITSRKWRLKKVSSGAQIGGAISTANIVGRVDGNAPGTRYIGENKKVSVVRSAPITISSATDTFITSTIVLDTGTWLVSGDIAFETAAASTITAGTTQYSITSSAGHPASDTIGVPTAGLVQYRSNAAMAASAVNVLPFHSYSVTIAAGATLTIRIIATATITGTVTVFGSLEATRIA